MALFLATRHENPETALRLARTELGSRSDVFTHDALAWSLAAAGNLAEAHSEMQRALAEGTEDARLFFHAAVIASQAVTQLMPSAGCVKRANSRSCFCHLNATNFKTRRRVSPKRRRPLRPTPKTLFRSDQIPRGKPNPNLKPKPKE